MRSRTSFDVCFATDASTSAKPTGRSHGWIRTPIARIPHRPLIKRVWELRHSVTAYDAAYVALAEELDVPLITCDGKLAESNSHHAKIELYSVD